MTPRDLAAQALYLVHTAWRLLQRLWLQLTVASTVKYLADCREDKLIDSLHVREWSAWVHDMRITVRALRMPLARPTRSSSPKR
jgi:hypothetical protein